MAVVDAEDYEWLSQWKWRANVRGPEYVYAVRTHRETGPDGREIKRDVYMHRELLGLEHGNRLMGDHIDGDTLDNRRTNIRRVTRTQNAMNQAASRSSTTGVKGVSWSKRKRRYIAHIRTGGRDVRLGYFRTLEEARAARRAADAAHFGKYSYEASRGTD